MDVDTDNGTTGQESPQMEIVMDRYLETPQEDKPDTSADELIDFDQFQAVLDEMQREDSAVVDHDDQENRPLPRPFVTSSRRGERDSRSGGFRFGLRQADAERLPWETQERTPTPSPTRNSERALFLPTDSASDTSVGPSRVRRHFRTPRQTGSRGSRDDMAHVNDAMSSASAKGPSTQAAHHHDRDSSDDDDLLPGSSVLGSDAHTPMQARPSAIPDEEDLLPGSSVIGSAAKTPPKAQSLAGSEPDEDILPASSVLNTPRQPKETSRIPRQQAPASIRGSETPRQASGLPQTSGAGELRDSQERNNGTGIASPTIHFGHSPGPELRLRPASDLLGLSGTDDTVPSPRRLGAGDIIDDHGFVPSLTLPRHSLEPHAQAVVDIAVRQDEGANAELPGELNVEPDGALPGDQVQDEATGLEPPAPSEPLLPSIHMPRNQRALVNHRQKRYEEPEFAGPDTDESDWGHALNHSTPPPVIHASSAILHMRTPLGEISANEIKNSPRSPLTREDLDEFLIVPPYEPLPPEKRFKSKLHQGPGPPLATPAPVRDPTATQADLRVTPEPSHEVLPDPDDLYMIDEDGSPLEPDSEYSVPHRYEFPPSRLHGQKDDQTSTYSRRAGTRRWTQDEAILMYRTVQKVPLDQAYPLRVVWYLYGEHGILSHDLEDFNPQHMKDKMKTIVQTRLNNRRPVIGRARFWLPPVGRGQDHPDKIALKAEIAEADKRAKEEFKELLLHEDDEVDVRPPSKKPSKRKASTGRKKRTTRSGKRDPSSDVEDDIETETARSDPEASAGPQEGEDELSDTSSRPPKRRRGRPRKTVTKETTVPKQKKQTAKRSAPLPANPAPKRTVRARQRGARSDKAHNTGVRTSGRRQLVVELPDSRRSTSHLPDQRAARHSKDTKAADSETDQDGNQVEALVETSQQDQPPSDAETDYGEASGKQMRRRSAGEKLLSSPSPMPTESDEDEDTDEANDVEHTQSNVEPTEGVAPEGAAEMPDDLDVVEGQKQTSYAIGEDGLDEDDPNARIAHQHELRQRILAGVDDTLPRNLRRR